MISVIQFDDTYLLNKFSEVQLHSLFKTREIIKRDFKQNHDIGFFSLPYQTELSEIKTLAKKVQKNSDYFLIIGIGGSSLGAKAAVGALESLKKPKIYFLENPNPDTLERKLSEINLKRTTINVISKSASTLETLSQFFIIFEKMKEVLNKNELKERVIVTTEPPKTKKYNVLYSLSEEFGWKTLPIPPNIGGRYSVLSPVGLFPMAVSGIDVDELLKGAQWVDQNSRDAYQYGTLAYGAHQILKRPLTVLFPYDERLSTFGDWFCQIWAESLAKSEGSGPTPIKAIGTIDQHSLLQLFLEGPRNKWYTMIGINTYLSKMCIPDSKILKQFSFLKNQPLAKILETQQNATKRSLIQYQNPLCQLTLSTLSPHTLGALFYYFELATAVAGYFYKVNPFDQPAVEQSKKWAQSLLQSTS